MASQTKDLINTVPIHGIADRDGPGAAIYVELLIRAEYVLLSDGEHDRLLYKDKESVNLFEEDVVRVMQIIQ